MKYCVLVASVVFGFNASWASARPEFECAGDVLDRLDQQRAAKLAYAPSTGVQGALVVYAKFQGEAPQDSLVPAYAHELFDPDKPGSVTHFYLAMSNGALRINGAALDRIYASDHDPSYYTVPDPETGMGKFDVFNQEVLTKVGADPAVDLGRYDNDGPDGVPNSGDDDGYVDFLFVNLLSIPSGFFRATATATSSLGFTDDLVTQDVRRSASGDSVGRIKIPGRWTARGGVTQRVRSFSYAVGSMAHEYGHVLGLPDLYDTAYLDDPGQPPDEDSAGIGNWGLMAQGTLGWSGDDGPNPLCTWCRAQLGWLGPGNENLVDVRSSMLDVVLEDAETGGKAYRLSISADEYFLVENRQRSGGHYDRNLPQSGVLIWHVDEGCNNRDERHKLVDLECADGLYRDGLGDPALGRDDLDNWAHDTQFKAAHGGNSGDTGDVFDGVGYTRFAHDTNPSSSSYSGLSQRLPSGIEVTNIRRDGARMVADFVVGRQAPGRVRQDTTWAGDVFVPGDVVVDTDATLTIAGGTTIRCGPGDAFASGVDSARCEFIVYGQLLLEAERERPITFTSAAEPSGPGDWFGIRLVGPRDGPDLKYVQIEYALQSVIRRELTEDAVWRGTLVLHQDAVVEWGTTLTIESGTTVQFADTDQWGRGYAAGQCELVVKGTLQVNGVPGRPVVFSTLGDAGQDSAWFGIVVEPGGSLAVDYAAIHRARYGIGGVITTHSQVLNSTIADCQWGVGVTLAPGAELSVRNSAIQGNELGVLGVGQGDLFLDRCNIRDNEDAGVFLGGCGLEASECLISDNGGPGLEGSGGRQQGIRLAHVTLTRNRRSGLSVGEWTGQVALADCRIEGNRGRGVHAVGAQRLELERVTVAANDSDGAYVQDAVVDARDCTFEGNGAWGLWAQEASGELANCTFIGGSGLRCTRAGVSVRLCEFRDNVLGLLSEDSATDIESNRFEGNRVAVRCTGSAAPVVVTRNAWLATQTWALENRTGLTMSAPDNWWGTTDEVRIESQIKGPVNWRPYLVYDPALAAAEMQLEQSAPNPFKGRVTIAYTLPETHGEGLAVLTLYNVLGQRVWSWEEAAGPGPHQVTWDGKDSQGRRVASGAYGYHLRWGGAERFGKLLYLGP